MLVSHLGDLASPVGGVPGTLLRDGGLGPFNVQSSCPKFTSYCGPEFVEAQ